MIPEKKIKQIKQEYEELKEKIYDSCLMHNQKKYSRISRRFKDIEEILNTYKKLKKIEKDIKGNNEIINEENDPELKELAKAELSELEAKYNKLFEVLKEQLAPKDPNDEKNAIVEIRAGTGGEEAALFVADLYRMYSYFAEKKGWKKSNVTANSTGLGGYKEISFTLSGKNVYGTMKFESGVHRVQRVPETESSGRIHTSAISVAVLPEADEVDIQINQNDLRIDVYRSSGHGGQSVNTTDSAVRITHEPTGLIVTCQDEKSQLKNKAKALKVLRSRLLEKEISKQQEEISNKRKLIVGSGDRSAKIRTYNFPQSRVTDHRINKTSYNLDNVLVGEIDEFINALKLAYKNEQMKG